MAVDDQVWFPLDPRHVAMRASVCTVPPAVEPVTLDEAKAQLRVDITDDDEYITGLIIAARESVEAKLWRKLITQTWQFYWPRFPHASRPMLLPTSPVQSITAVAYKTTDGNTTTLTEDTDYVVDTTADQGGIYCLRGQSWAAPESNQLWPVNAVSITAVMGYGDTSDSVPERFKLAIKMTVGEWYLNREASVSTGGQPKELPMAVTYLLTQEMFRVNL